MIEDLKATAGGDPLQMPFDQALEATSEGKVLVVDLDGKGYVDVAPGSTQTSAADTCEEAEPAGERPAHEQPGRRRLAA